MSIGTRIMEIRKKNNLSQEAFGDTLGVSRQAISKWEMDASIPDVEKLILMSHIYHVSVGYILEMEQDENRQDEKVSAVLNHENTELTSDQLKMVEEIVTRYLEATSIAPQERNNIAKRWWIVACGVGLAFFCVLLYFGAAIRNLDDKYQSISGNISSLSNKVEQLESNVTNRLEGQLQEVLEEVYEVITDYGWEMIAYDLEENTVTYALYVDTKIYSGTTRAIFVLATENEERRVEATREGNRFLAEIVCPRSNETEFKLLLITDGVTEVKKLDTIKDPLGVAFFDQYVMASDVIEESPYENGVLRLEKYSLQMDTDSCMKGPIGESPIVKAELIYYVNEEKYQSFDLPIEIVKENLQWEYEFDLEIPLGEGDSVVEIVRYVDEIGRQMRIFLSGCQVIEGQVVQMGLPDGGRFLDQ